MRNKRFFFLLEQFNYSIYPPNVGPKDTFFPKFTGAMTHFKHLCRMEGHKMNIEHKMHILLPNLYVDKTRENHHNL